MMNNRETIAPVYQIRQTVSPAPQIRTSS